MTEGHFKYCQRRFQWVIVTNHFRYYTDQCGRSYVLLSRLLYNPFWWSRKGHLN